MLRAAVPQGTEPTESDRLLAALEPVTARYRDTRERRESLAILKVLRLTRDLETAEAVLRGERVPRSRLDPYWLKAYGL